jgi:hypothetical protein
LLSIAIIVGKIPLVSNMAIAWTSIGLVILGYIINGVMAAIYIKKMTPERWYMIGIPFSSISYGMK